MVRICSGRSRLDVIRTSVLLLLFAGVVSLTITGCRVSRKVRQPETPLEVKVVETEGAKTVDAETAESLKSQSKDRQPGWMPGAVEERDLQEALSATDTDDTAKESPAGKEPALTTNESESAATVDSESAERPGGPGFFQRQPKTKKPPRPETSEVTPQLSAQTETIDRVKLPALAEPGMADKLISVDFNKVDIRIVLKTIGELTGINFLVDDPITGDVTLISPTKIRLGEVYKVLESILEVKGYAAVPSGNLVKIVPRAEASKRNLMTRVGSDPATIPLEDSIVTQIIPLRFADANEMRTLISPLASAGSYLATYPQSNAILITDTSSNIHHIARIIQEFDIPGIQEELFVVRLKYASAQVLSQQIAQIMEPTRQAQVTTPARRPGTTPPARVTRAQITQAGLALKILPDDRTNSLIVMAGRRDVDTIKELVGKLDIERPLAAGNIHVVYLKHATAEEIVKSLSTAVEKSATAGGPQRTEPLQITADESTNALIITASPQDFKVIEDMIQKLDIVREQVLVELHIMEVSEEALKDIGIEWATLDQAVSDSIRGFGFTDFGLRLEAASGSLTGLAVGAFKSIGPDDAVQIGAILKLLEGHSGVNILSTPHILTSNHQEAKIIVAENIPFVTQSRITEVDPLTPTVIDTFEYRDVGIELNITPHVSKDGPVRLEIDSIFEKVIEGRPGIGVDLLTTAKREAHTVVAILSGSTVVIGGLIRDDVVTSEDKVPVLGDIPLLGRLFKRNIERLQKTNLLLFITPHVLTSTEELENMTARKEAEAGRIKKDQSK